MLLVDYNCYCGRMGTLKGKFLVKETFWEEMFGEKWYASDVLGKHSEFNSTIGCTDDRDEKYKEKTITEEQLKVLQEVFDFECSEEDFTYFTISGFNPLDYIQE